MRSKTSNVAHINALQEQQKDTLAQLMEARLGEIERLQDARDAVRLEILKARSVRAWSQQARLAKRPFI